MFAIFRRNLEKIIRSVMFLCAGLLLGLVSLFGFFLAAEEAQEPEPAARHPHPFLADNKRALVYYNVLSSVYDVLNPYLYTSSMRNEVVKLLRRNCGNVLDVGCGTGYTTCGLLQSRDCSKVSAIDQNPRQLKIAAKKLISRKARLSLFRAEALTLPFKDEVFDAVVSVGVIEYFPKPEKTLQEVARVTKPGGRVIIGGPELNWFRRFRLDRVFYTPPANDLENMFTEAGLRTVRTMFVGPNTLFGTDRYAVLVAGAKR